MSIDHIGQLKPDATNRRQHNPRNIGMIAASLNEIGAARSIVIDEHDNILAGNGTIEAAAQAGIERLRVIDADGEEIIAVRRSNLTDAQKRRLALFDNRTAELAEWDVDQLLADVTEGLDFEGMFQPYELAALLRSVAANDPAAEWVGMPEFEQDDRMPYFQIIVNFASSADVDAFSRLVGQHINQELGEKRRHIWYPKVDRQDRQGQGYATDES